MVDVPPEELREQQQNVIKSSSEDESNRKSVLPPMVNPEEEMVDSRSIYVGNVDYAATPAELQEHFRECGPINRITIMVDRWSGHPKGYAYIEFADENAVNTALRLEGSLFRERALKVMKKRRNIPGRGRRGGRGNRGFRGGGRGKRRGGGANYSVTPY